MGGRGPATGQRQTRANWGPQGSPGDRAPAEESGYWEQAEENDWGPADTGADWGPAASGPGPAPASGVRMAGAGAAGRGAVRDRAAGPGAGGRAAADRDPAAGPAAGGRATAVRDRSAGPGAGGRAAAGDKRSSAKASSAKLGGIIITAASLLATVLVILILNFDAGAGARQKSQDAAVMAPVTELGTLASGYSGFAALDNQQLGTAISNYNANENSNFAAARSALRSEVAAEQSFNASLTSWLAVWKSDYAAAKALQANGVADPDEPVIINIPYSSSVTKTAEALLAASQASESMISQQAQAGTLAGMRSFNGAHQAANNSVEAQATLMREELHLPSA